MLDESDGVLATDSRLFRLQEKCRQKVSFVGECSPGPDVADGEGHACVSVGDPRRVRRQTVQVTAINQELKGLRRSLDANELQHCGRCRHINAKFLFSVVLPRLFHDLSNPRCWLVEREAPTLAIENLPCIRVTSEPVVDVMIANAVLRSEDPARCPRMLNQEVLPVARQRHEYPVLREPSARCSHSTSANLFSYFCK